MNAAAVCIAMLALIGSPAALATGIRGNPDAVAAARKLLEQAGGDAWRAPLFEAEERAYLNSGETAELRITRDLARTARLLHSIRPSGAVTEWISPEGGWIRRGDVVTPIAPEELEAELQGLRQEPYAIYHRLAHDDPALRVALQAKDLLYVYDGDERLLCWFQLAANGALLGWGNFYDGAINQHYYGPSADMGDANLPRFGISSTGSFRFEYLRARLTDGKLRPDAESSPGTR